MSTVVENMRPSAPTTPSKRHYDVAVIGGGAVGLATAMALVQQYKISIIVVEAENRLAAHQTGNNSGVIHSGLYYKPGSLKATMCTESREALYRFCEERNITHERCGKIVVALDDSERPQLETIMQRGIANGLKNLKVLPIEELRQYEPHVAGVAGLFVEETGIVSYKQVTRAYADVVREHGGEVHTSAKVRGITRSGGKIVLQTTIGDIECSNLVNCGGIMSDRIAAMCGMNPEVQMVPFRGEYYNLKPEAHYLVKNLIYPVPNPAFPFLGVHFTRMAEGGIEAGPNAVLALARHGYSWGQINLKDFAGTMFFGGFWKMARKYWKTGFGEMHRSLSKKAFHKALSRLMPDLKIEHLEPGGAGVRAQAMDSTGAMVDDFRIQKGEHMVHVLNAPSPAATASISIGKHIAGTASLVGDLSKRSEAAAFA